MPENCKRKPNLNQLLCTDKGVLKSPCIPIKIKTKYNCRRKILKENHITLWNIIKPQFWKIWTDENCMIIAYLNAKRYSMVPKTVSRNELGTCVTHLPQKVDSNLPYLLWKARNELGNPKMNKKWQILLKHNQTGSEMSIRYRGKNDKFTSISFHRRM